MTNNMIPQHEPLRCPPHWSGNSQQDFVVQLERVLTDLYKHIGLLRREIENLKQQIGG